MAGSVDAGSLATTSFDPSDDGHAVSQAKENRALVLVVIAIAAFGAFVWFGGSDTVSSSGSGLVTAPSSGEISIADLPSEAIDTLELIDSGGPFPYRKDGSVFQNREGRLPDHDNGYYREYTVDTPGSPDRGARRIVGGDAGERYYTGDHYDSFARIIDW